MKLNFFKNLKINLDVFKFTFLKYIEIAITSLITLIVAKEIGPLEMGKAIPVLLFVTYSNYLALGVNQALVKNYSRMKNRLEVLNFITINFQYLLLICVLTFVSAYFLLIQKYFFFSALISAGVLFKGFFMAYFRSINRIFVLNKNNIIFSLLFLLSVLIFVKNWYDYIICWAICLWISNFIYFLDSKVFFLIIIKNIKSIPAKINILFNLKQGLKLATFGVISTILLTSDRIIVNKLDVSLELKGSYQLADYVSMGFFMLITTISFYYTPVWISKIRVSASFRKLFYKRFSMSLLFFPALIGVIYLFSRIFVDLFFPEYDNLIIFIVLSSILKILVSFISLSSIIFMGLDKEIDFIKSMVPIVVLYVISILLFLFVIQVKIYIIPLVLSFLLVVEFIRKMRYIKANLLH